jgi:hypothetical protein
MNPMPLLQAELDFAVGDPAGHQRWLDDQARRLARVCRDYGLPIGFPVRLKLRDFDRELTGRLALTEFPLESGTGRPLSLRVGPVEFASTEIEYCVREDTA